MDAPAKGAISGGMKMGGMMNLMSKHGMGMRDVLDIQDIKTDTLQDTMKSLAEAKSFEGGAGSKGNIARRKYESLNLQKQYATPQEAYAALQEANLARHAGTFPERQGVFGIQATDRGRRLHQSH